MVPLMTVAMGMLKPEQMGNAIGIFALARNLAGSIGIAMVTAQATRGAQTHQATLLNHVTPYDLAYQTTLQTAQAALAPQEGPMQAQSLADGAIYQSMLQQSGMLAYMDDFRWLALICFISIPLVVLLKRVVTKEPMMAHWDHYEKHTFLEISPGSEPSPGDVLPCRLYGRSQLPAAPSVGARAVERAPDGRRNQSDTLRRRLVEDLQ
jgi:hypothetical protein